MFMNIRREALRFLDLSNRRARIAGAAAVASFSTGYWALAVDLPFVSAFQDLADQLTGPVAIVMGILALCYICYGMLTGNASRAIMQVVCFIVFITVIFWAPDALEWLRESVG